MNVVKEIQRINEKELSMGSKGSWHDQYKDSAYIFVGGLNYGMTEGDVVTVFSQYGEIVDINMPRDKETGKQKGFAFIMYEDQRSTILAVDNLNGAKVLERTLRVDHVGNYKQKRTKNEDGTYEDPEEPSMNALPQIVQDEAESDDGSVSSAPSIDPEDPMRDYLIAKRKEKSKSGKKKSKKHEDETPEERKARKARKKAKKEAKARGVGGDLKKEDRARDQDHDQDREMPSSRHRRDHSRSRSPQRPRREDSDTRMDYEYDSRPRREDRDHDRRRDKERDDGQRRDGRR